MIPPLIDNRNLPLVLLGGTLCNARLWQPVIARLNVSSVTSLMVCGADSAREFSAQALEALPPRFCLAGFSLGAIAALQILADAPERIAGLALLSVNPFSDLPANAAVRRSAVDKAAAQGIGHWLTETLWPKYVAPQNQDNSQLHATIAQMAEECGMAVFTRQTEIAICRDDHRQALAAFAAPTLILNGQHDVICTPRHHQATAALNSRWLTHPSSGHFLPLEAPFWVADALRTWIKEILS
ncbi:MAG TPA: alpha/beta hydrolase [Buttiauxella sp.]|jgi:pimeloyl-ACP methyl ester carboxylesterase